MDQRAAHLIAALRLQRHPEGGYFREVFRSPRLVHAQQSHDARSALTTIYFLLAADDVSRWHRLTSDELWHFYEGSPLELLTIDERASVVERRRLGPLAQAGALAGGEPVLVVPAHTWQAARTTGAYTLVGCSVAPGFEYAEFELLRDRPRELAHLTATGLDLRTFI